MAYRLARAASGANTASTTYSLRHSYATAMLAAGLTPHAVAKLLGHSGTHLVLNRYGHVLPDEVEAFPSADGADPGEMEWSVSGAK